MGLSDKIKERVIKILDESNPEEVEKIVYNLAETLKKMEEDVMLAREEGIEEGIEKGIERGIESGIERGKIQVAKNLLAKNTNPDFIAEVTGLSIEDIEKIQTESNEKIH